MKKLIHDSSLPFDKYMKMYNNESVYTNLTRSPQNPSSPVTTVSRQNESENILSPRNSNSSVTAAYRHSENTSTNRENAFTTESRQNETSTNENDLFTTTVSSQRASIPQEDTFTVEFRQNVFVQSFDTSVLTSAPHVENAFAGQFSNPSFEYSYNTEEIRHSQHLTQPVEPVPSLPLPDLYTEQIHFESSTLKRSGNEMTEIGDLKRSRLSHQHSHPHADILSVGIKINFAYL